MVKRTQAVYKLHKKRLSFYKAQGESKVIKYLSVHTKIAQCMWGWSLAAFPLDIFLLFFFPYYPRKAEIGSHRRSGLAKEVIMFKELLILQSDIIISVLSALESRPQ